MGYQPRIKSPKRPIHEYRKIFGEKRKRRKRIDRGFERPSVAEKHIATEQEVSELTLKRLHTLGNQRFGSSPFSEHFDRWLSNISAVLSEFESPPNISLDDQFILERSETLATIKQQLEDRRRKEESVDQEAGILSNARNQLKQINTDYSTAIQTIKRRKNGEIKRLNKDIKRLEKEQDVIIQLKTGFFRGLSKKEKERKEIEIAQQIDEKQRELELVMLNFNAEQRQLREDYETRKEPVWEQIKILQKKAREMENDGSLEERWFACEALIDAVNTFLQRKAASSHNSLEADQSGI